VSPLPITIFIQPVGDDGIGTYAYRNDTLYIPANFDIDQLFQSIHKFIPWKLAPPTTTTTTTTNTNINTTTMIATSS
jgi:hypothetical protein